MNSKFLLFAFFGLISVSLCSQTSSAFAQEDFQLKYGAFHQPSSILADDNLIFFTPADHDGPSSISVQDTKTGSLLFKIQSPHKDLDDDWFGKHMSLVGSNIAASSIFLDPQTDEWTTMVHVFDGKTGKLIYTVENPISDSMHFGYALKSIGDKLAVYSSDADPNDYIHDNVVHVFDGKDGSLLYTIENPLEIGDFGKSISAIDNIFLVHTMQDTDSNLSGAIHAFDADTGNLLYTIEHPQKDTGDIDPCFGGQSIISGESVIVRSGDAAYVFDGVTGELNQTVDRPVTTNGQLDAILGSPEDVTETYNSDDPPFSRIFAFFENLFSWIMQSPQEDDSALSEQETHQLIQNETSESTQITGIHAQTICKIIESYCSDQKSFHATFDSSDGYTKFRYSQDGTEYYFRISGDKLEYHTNQNPDQWTSYEDQWMWDYDSKTRDEATDYSKYVHVRQFSGDELGYYERWCNVFDGDWLDEAYQCGFKDDQDYKAAQKDLDQVLRPSIEGEKAEIFCEILHKECDERTVFKANYDPRTDVTHYDGFVEGLGGIAIRMIDNKISYANSYNADTWFEWAHFPEILEGPNLQDGEALSPSQESKSFKIIQYGMFDAEDDGNLVDQLYVGETYWFYLEYQNELDARQKVRTFVMMQDKDTGDILRKTDAHGFEKPKERTGHGFEWIPEYEGEFKMKGEFRTLYDPLVSAVIPQYDFVVVEKP